MVECRAVSLDGCFGIDGETSDTIEIGGVGCSRFFSSGSSKVSSTLLSELAALG